MYDVLTCLQMWTNARHRASAPSSAPTQTADSPAVVSLATSFKRTRSLVLVRHFCVWLVELILQGLCEHPHCESPFLCAGCDSMHWGYNCNQSCGCSQNALQCDSARGCTCRAGWSGSLCDVNVNECADPSLCSATEVCVDSQGSYSCQCIDGYQRNTSGICQSKSSSPLILPTRVF